MNAINENIESDYQEISSTEKKKTYRKIILRILPFLFLAYTINGIDRINISFAKLRMSEDLMLSDITYGIGASAFFIGYLIFEVPSNLYMQKVGTRATITRIMILWGTITILMSTIENATGFYILRFLLGAAEAGFFPGVILYLTYWFPDSLRGRITSVFFMAGILAGVISGPLAGWIMSNFHGWMGLKDWQALFVLEGIPAVMLGVFAWFWLVDRPKDAKWLTERQKYIVQQTLMPDQTQTVQTVRTSFKSLLLNGRVLLAGFIYFGIFAGANTTTFWLPTMIKESGISNLRHIGLITSLPYITAFILMYILGRSSDKYQERRWHLAIPMVVGAACFALFGLVSGNVPLSIGLLLLAATACVSSFPLFWTIPPTFFSSASAPVGIAIVSTIGTLAAVLSPIIVGVIKTYTGNIHMALYAVALLLFCGAAAVIFGIPARLLKENKI